MKRDRAEGKMDIRRASIRLFQGNLILSYALWRWLAMLEREGKRGLMRDSDNPILEEYKEDLLNRPITMAQNEERIARLEGLLNELMERTRSLERRVEILEGRG